MHFVGITHIEYELCESIFFCMPLSPLFSGRTPKKKTILLSVWNWFNTLASESVRQLRAHQNQHWVSFVGNIKWPPYSTLAMSNWMRFKAETSKGLNVSFRVIIICLDVCVCECVNTQKTEVVIMGGKTCHVCVCLCMLTFLSIFPSTNFNNFWLKFRNGFLADVQQLLFFFKFVDLSQQISSLTLKKNTNVRSFITFYTRKFMKIKLCQNRNFFVL